MTSSPRLRSDVRAIQRRGLTHLLRDVLPGNEFYSRKFSAAGIDPGSIDRLEQLEDLPFTTKEELQADQAAHPPYGSNLSQQPSAYVRLHQSSGSSGQPLR